MMKLLKAISCAALCVAFALASVVPAFANDGTYIRDDYGILSDSEFESMEVQAESISESIDCGVYLVFCAEGYDDGEGTAQDYYTDNSLGMGNNKSGIVFLVAIDSRDWGLVTKGTGNDTFLPYYSYITEDCVIPLLSEDEFAEAGQAYLDACLEIASGDVSDTYYEDDYADTYIDGSGQSSEKNYLLYLVIGLVVGLIAAALVCFGFYKQMKTAKEKTEANDYLDKKSFELTRKHDQFLHSTVTKVPIPKDNDHDGGGGGFGGGGGKF